MSAKLTRLSIDNLEMLLQIQCEKVVREAEVKQLVEEVAHKTECMAAEKATQKAEGEVRAKAWKAMEVMDTNSDTELGPLQKKGKSKARAVSVGSMGKAEVAEVLCQW
jgi:hypothetical protein